MPTLFILYCRRKHSYSASHVFDKFTNTWYAAARRTLTIHFAGGGRCLASAVLIKSPWPVVGLWYFNRLNAAPQRVTDTLNAGIKIHAQRRGGWGADRDGAKNWYSATVVEAIISANRLKRVLQIGLLYLLLFLSSLPFMPVLAFSLISSPFSAAPLSKKFSFLIIFSLTCYLSPLSSLALLVQTHFWFLYKLVGVTLIFFSDLSFRSSAAVWYS